MIQTSAGPSATRARVPKESGFGGEAAKIYSRRGFLSLMWWTASTLRHRSAIGWLRRNATTLRGAVHGRGYHDRDRYYEVGVSDSRRRCRWHGGNSQA